MGWDGVVVGAGPAYRAAVGAAGRAVWGRTAGTGTHGGCR
jgi:hypothetical protein